MAESDLTDFQWQILERIHSGYDIYADVGYLLALDEISPAQKLFDLGLIEMNLLGFCATTFEGVQWVENMPFRLRPY